MKLSTGRIKLHSAMKTLKSRWETIKPGWHDPVSQDIDEKLFVPLEQQVATTLRAIDRLAQVLDQAQHDLSDE